LIKKNLKKKLINNKNINSTKKIYRIFGINNCFNLLLYNQKFSILKIFVDNSSKVIKNHQIMDVIQSKDYSVNFINHDEFIRDNNYKHSQGIVVEFCGDLYNSLDLCDFFKKNMCFIIADQITDPQNFGQILRTCECAGIDGIIIPKHKSIQMTNTVLQVSQGAFMHVNVYRPTNIKSSIDYLKSKGFWIIGLENSIDSDEWYNMDYKGKVAIVIGSEGSGIRKLTKKSCDFLTTINMHGKINSLNVTAALSAIVFERQRQLDS
tara:strand:- start:329 stop:1120 length:792 start_codon:yes stop_codon:yes gene_type:complete